MSTSVRRIKNLAVAGIAVLGALVATSAPAQAETGRSTTAVAVPAHVAKGDASVSVYNYVSGYQYVHATGASVKLTAQKPRLAFNARHSLAELAVQSADGRQIVEIGWNVDPGLYGDLSPHLFVFHWTNRVGSCYNGCGFVRTSRLVKPGQRLGVGVTHRYGLNYTLGKWWATLDGRRIGYVPESAWKIVPGGYRTAGLIQAFGEVNASSNRTCTAMGNGRYGSHSGSSQISGFTLIGARVAGQLQMTVTRPTSWNARVLTPTSFRFGGPGSC
jgi:hypothetical protein